MGYQMPIFKEFVKKSNVEVHVIHWDVNKKTPYVPDIIANVFYYKRSEFNYQSLNQLIKKIDPQITFISGWMDFGYLRAVRPIIKKGIPVVVGFDDIWFKTIKQRIASIFFPFFKSIFFTHAWVSGPFQYEYARRLGFVNIEIIYNLYSADNLIFNKFFHSNKILRAQEYPHRFLFVGRFEHVKGVDLLIEAWNNIKGRRKDWELCLIGNGSLYDSIKMNSDIKLMEFLQPEKLVEEIGQYGCFILPSRFEPWALVIHEFALAGFPILCTDVCGAANTFVISNYNGYTIKPNSVSDIEDKMLKIINLNDNELINMGDKSNLIGQRITPEISAASFLSILYQD
jgi:glycosyltransferase involved in cell wall biosynthesis